MSRRDVLARNCARDDALDESAKRRTLPIAGQTQGAAVAAVGVPWMARRGGQFGRLRKVDAETGMVMASFAMHAGIEDIGFAPGAWLRTVSEAGSQRWSGWRAFHPLVFSVDSGALR